MVEEFAYTSNIVITTVRLLETLVRFIAEQDIGRLRDEGFIEFSAYQDMYDWSVINKIMQVIIKNS